MIQYLTSCLGVKRCGTSNKSLLTHFCWRLKVRETFHVNYGEFSPIGGRTGVAVKKKSKKRLQKVLTMKLRFVDFDMRLQPHQMTQENRSENPLSLFFRIRHPRQKEQKKMKVSRSLAVSFNNLTSISLQSVTVTYVRCDFKYISMNCKIIHECSRGKKSFCGSIGADLVAQARISCCAKLTNKMSRFVSFYIPFSEMNKISSAKSSSHLISFFSLRFDNWHDDEKEVRAEKHERLSHNDGRIIIFSFYNFSWLVSLSLWRTLIRYCFWWLTS